MSVYSRLPEIKAYSPEKSLISGTDKDTLLIAAILLLMIKEKSDMKLILALAYILL